MSKVKRLICLSLALVMVFSLMLSGCGSTKGEPAAVEPAKTAEESTEPAAEATVEDTAPQLEPYELNCYWLAPQAKDVPLVQEEMNKILKEKINATVKLNVFWWDSYQDKQKLLVASGEKIDTMFSPSWWGFGTFVAQQAWLELDDLLAEYGKDIVANINPAYLEAPRFGGKLYGIPTGKDMFGTGGVLINKAMAEKYNMDFSNVKTPADLEPMLQIIKDKEPGVVPFLSTKGDHTNYFTQDFFEHLSATENPVGYRKTDGAVTIINKMEMPEYVQNVKLTESWYKKSLINKDVATLQDGMPIKKAQKAFMWGEQLKPGKADEMKAQLGYDLLQVEVWSGIQHYATTNDLCNSMLVISRTSEDPARAMMFINLLFSDKQLKNLLSWGIENKHYKKIGENQIDYADGVTAETSGYTGVAQWALGGSQFLDYLWANEATDKWEKMEAFNNSAKSCSTLGWIFDQESVKTEMATLNNVGKTYGEPIGEGITNYDTQYPKMKKALETAGIQKVIDEAQRQVDEYLASKK